MGLSTVFGVDRYQIEPNSFYEINLRYADLMNSDYTPHLTKPLIIPLKDSESLLFQLNPSLSPNGDEHNLDLQTWIQIGLGDDIIVVNEMRVNYAAQNDSTYIGKKWRSLSGFTNQSFFCFKRKLGSKAEMNLQAGRFFRQHGPGRHGQLLLGANIRPMDQIAFSLNRQISNSLSVRFFFQTSALDKIGSDKRFMSLHRVELIANRWYVALSEALTYTRKNQGMDLVYLNPFIFYHPEQLNGPDLSGNTIGTIEFGYKWNTSNIYAEILIDDVQFDNEVKGDLEPNEIGGLLGYEHAADKYYLSIEGVALTNRTYKTPNPAEWFLHRNQPIGYELGSDVGRINLLARYYFKQNWHIDTKIDMIWQGEGDLTHPWDTPWDDESVTMETGYSEPFPTGVVEQSTVISTELMRHWTRERWISLGVSYKKVVNVDHVSDIDNSEFSFHLGASWTLEYGTIFEEN